MFLLTLIACNERKVISENEAIKIAGHELLQKYGDEILNQKPLKASSSNEKWTISGTLNCSKNEICSGGIGVIEIDAKTGRILRIEHT